MPYSSILPFRTLLLLYNKDRKCNKENINYNNPNKLKDSNN
jgi:hypothetical protein